jgi:hypothetical protein
MSRKLSQLFKWLMDKDVNSAEKWEELAHNVKEHFENVLKNSMERCLIQFHTAQLENVEKLS